MANISIIGTGYVGLVAGACFSEIGHKVTCVDVDATKVASIKKKVTPIHETGLQKLLEKNIEIIGREKVLVYNSPYKFFNRRNEIIIPINYKKKLFKD